MKPEEKDLFFNQEQLPQNVKQIVFEMSEVEINEGFDYKKCNKYQSQLEKLGYTFDYELDATPYNLQKIKQ